MTTIHDSSNVLTDNRVADETDADYASRGDLEKFAIWLFAVFCFVALAFCFYIIFAKCEGKWPF